MEYLWKNNVELMEIVMSLSDKERTNTKSVKSKMNFTLFTLYFLLSTLYFNLSYSIL